MQQKMWSQRQIFDGLFFQASCGNYFKASIICSWQDFVEYSTPRRWNPCSRQKSGLKARSTISGNLLKTSLGCSLQSVIRGFYGLNRNSETSEATKISAKYAGFIYQQRQNDQQKAPMDYLRRGFPHSMLPTFYASRFFFNSMIF